MEPGKLIDSWLDFFSSHTIILQVCIAEALYDAEAILSNPSAFKAEEIRTLRDQIVSNLERAWELTGGTEDELTGVMVQIAQVVAKQFSDKK